MKVVELRCHFRSTSERIRNYFNAAIQIVPQEDPDEFGFGFARKSPDCYWSRLSGDLKLEASNLVEEILPLCARLAHLTRSASLTGPEDTQEVKLATKGIRAAIYLKEFSYLQAEVLHDEGTVLGVRPAKQNEDEGLSPQECLNVFERCISDLASVLDLIESAPDHNETSSHMEKDTQKYRSGTGFIMMWMDPRNPELCDVVDAVKEVFKRFDINAVRADDIEHEGQITDRVLNEIRTSEFLFADLTGTRPNVYYETGFAHALGKRVIMFRKSGTSIHFDLAGYNCPEYENIRDLREKLTKRLENITSKKPRNDNKI
jgi:hypothetical protein